MPCIKVHHFDYQKVKNTKSINVHSGEQPARKQAIRMKNGQVRTIVHYDKRNKGRTLGEMVYETYRV